MSVPPDALRQSDVEAFVAAEAPCLCVRHNPDQGYAIWYSRTANGRVYCLVHQEQKLFQARRLFNVVPDGSGWLWLVVDTAHSTLLEELVLRELFPDMLMEAML